MGSDRTALVVGASGFCGQHLIRHLLRSGCQVTGLDQRGLPDSPAPIVQQDILSAELVHVLQRLRPSTVFHLAALTDPRLPLLDFFRVNVLGTLSLLQAVAKACPQARILLVGTSAIYGACAKTSQLIDETAPFCPMTPYAWSKLVQELLAVQQATQHGLDLVRARTFNLTGPGESERFVTSAIALQIAEIEAGRREPVVRIGNLESVRDFTDVRDAVRAYRLLVEQAPTGEVYHVCSARGTSIRTVLDRLLSLSRRRDIAVQVDPLRFQAVDVPIQVGSYARLRALTGWQPQIPLEDTLKDVLEYWRSRVSATTSEQRFR